jgi:DivIVA domain-containing protein
MVTPADINQKQFSTTRLKEGYVQEEVDDFLDAVEVDYAKALGDRDKWEREAARLRAQLASAGSEASTTVIPPVPAVLPSTPAGSAEKILVAAQRTADMVESEANAEAGKIRAAARAEADNVRSTAEVDRQKILNQLETERRELEERIEQLKAKRTNYKSWLRAALIKLEEEEANDV